MYLYFYILFTIRFLQVLSNCGCALNRNTQCLKEDFEHKYLEKYNKDDNKNSLENVHKYAFNTSNMIYIEGDVFQMGTNEPVFEGDFEGPMKNTSVGSFYLDKYEVSNQDFLNFVEKTGYLTEAEQFGDSFIFDLLIDKEDRDKYDDVRAVGAPWWVKMKGVAWKHPEGKASSIKGNWNFVTFTKRFA